MKRHFLTLMACITLMTGIFTATAFAQDPVRIRGDIMEIGDHSLTVKSNEGIDVTFVLADDSPVTGIVAASLEDVNEGVFVGITAVPGEGGVLTALEVHIFPEAMRGAGEGHYPWDLVPESTMTNANIESAVSSVDGRTLHLTHKDGEQTILVPEDASIVRLMPADQSWLKPGTGVFIVARPGEGDAWVPLRIAAGKDGVKPPM